MSAISLVAVLLYGLAGAVAWPEAGIMMAGAVLGGYLGGRLSLKVPQQGLRWVVILLGGFLSVYYFVYGT
jgi:uncharacterized protein